MSLKARRPLLYGADNRPLKLRATAYDGAGTGRRARHWNPGNESANSITSYEVDWLRARSRDMVRRAPLAATAKSRYVSNIVGTGMVPVSKAPDPKFKSALRELWDDWVEESDADGLSDFYGQQALAMGQCWEAGECFARLRPRRSSDGLTVPLQVQLLEPDFLRSNMNENLAGGRRIRQGIEFDPLGRRVAYHFYREHPGERFSYGGIQTTRVAASEVLQVFEPLRPGQLRGLPRLSSVLTLLYEIEGSSDAHRARQRVAALFAYFFTRPVDPATEGEADPDDPNATIESIEPGTGYGLLPGEDVTFPTVPDAGSYIEFRRSQEREFSGPVGLTYEQASGDVSQVNYSSIRANLLEIRRTHTQTQHGVLAFRFCNPVYKAWLNAAVVSGAVAAPLDFVERQRAYLRAKWIPEGWQWVDPEKEIKAIVLAIRAGLMTRSMAVATYGYDSEEIDREMADDNARADELGLKYESDGRVQTKQQLGGPTAPRKEDQDEEDDEGQEAREDAEAA